MKHCSCCGVEKDGLDFYKNRKSKDGLTSKCKVCHNISVERYRKANMEKVKAAAQRWQKQNLEKCRVKNQRSYRKRPEWFTERNARRRAAQLQASPSWANADAIRSYYAMAKWLTMTVPGQVYHVDHIIPLINPIVCGLHVEHNLSILRSEDNLRKSNTYILE